LGRSQSFEALVTSIRHVDVQMRAQAGRAVNISLTLRNWMIGFYIEEYERVGVDRARYGERLMDELAAILKERGVSRADRRELYRYRRFYLVYPQVVEVAVSLSPSVEIQRTKDHRKVESPTPQSPVSGKWLVEHLSFTHIVELIDLEDASQRAFYEAECIRGNWSVRELKRQISSLFYERTGLSKDKARLVNRVRRKAETATPVLTIRDPYVFEFLGIEPPKVMSESALEASLLDKLQKFLLELGHGFCFEARQKRILVGETYYFVDLVFYHRVLKCHVLIELKTDEFRHEHLGQLNMYVSWFAKNTSTEGDGPPVGLLLCTHKDSAVVEYALAGMDNQLFVSKYQLALPDQEAIRRFMDAQMSVSAGRRCTRGRGGRHLP
jgi:predicted nuclease of restriction endonuclease-like (RecB) superfamily